MSTPTPRTAALIAACACLAMAVIAPLSLFDPAQLPAALPVETGGAPWPSAVTAGVLKLILGLGVVVVLDIIIAWSLYHLFRQDSARIALWMMITRVAYALLFAFALMYAMQARDLMQDVPFDAASAAEVADFLRRFQAGWDLALIIFSAHLLLLASLVWSDGLWRRVLAVLLAIAGLGYFADSLIAFTLPDVTFRFALFTFAGELALIVWLFAAGGRGVSPPASGCSGS